VLRRELDEVPPGVEIVLTVSPGRGDRLAVEVGEQVVRRVLHGPHAPGDLGRVHRGAEVGVADVAARDRIALGFIAVPVALSRPERLLQVRQ
jgi:hypothetical protein